MVLGGAQVSATPKKSTHCALCKYIYIYKSSDMFIFGMFKLSESGDAICQIHID